VRVVMFYHSVVSDWNHGNAHFLRGVIGELMARGHSVTVLEPEDSWSRTQLRQEHGSAAIERFHRAYPAIRAGYYHLDALDLDRELESADLVLVHEWNEPALVAALGHHRSQSGSYRLLFHDTHHRSVTKPEEMAAYRLEHYDGVLAFGDVIRRRYLEEGWADQVWTWHEAADTRVFRPLRQGQPTGDLVWIGNWGDEERTAELERFLVRPIVSLGLSARVHGVRYPPAVQQQLARAGIEFAGWIPNYQVPEIFGRFRMTVHIPRRPYVEALPGIPTIRVFEALACGIPLICSAWDDKEGLFSPGEDFLVAHDAAEMHDQIRFLLDHPDVAHAMAEHGLRTIVERHTCGHRVDELLAIVDSLNAPPLRKSRAAAGM
jgi:spore maturation protein CgeB